MYNFYRLLFYYNYAFYKLRIKLVSISMMEWLSCVFICHLYFVSVIGHRMSVCLSCTQGLMFRVF